MLASRSYGARVDSRVRSLSQIGTGLFNQILR